MIVNQGYKAASENKLVLGAYHLSNSQFPPELGVWHVDKL